MVKALAALAVIPVAFVIHYEALTGLSAQWTRNQALVEQRVKLIHTNQGNGQFHEFNYKANILEIGKYSDQWLCASGKDASKCKKKSW